MSAAASFATRHYLAHLVSGTIVPREWIPMIFEPASGVLLAGIVALRWLPRAGLPPGASLSLERGLSP